MIESILAIILAVWVAFSVSIIAFGLRIISNLREEISKQQEKIDQFQNETRFFLRLSEKNSELLSSNESLRVRHIEYRKFFGITLAVLLEDTQFLRMSMFQAFANVPEFQEANKLMISFENKLEAIKLALREYKMIDTDFDQE